MENTRKRFNKNIQRSLIEQQLFYKSIRTGMQEEKQRMIEDIEATRHLQGICIETGEHLILDTERGIEIGHRLDTQDINNAMKDKKIERLFVDICMEGFSRREVTKEFYNDIANHMGDEDTMEVLLYGKREPVFFQGEWRKIEPTDWRFDRLGAICTYSVIEIEGKKILYFGAVMTYPDLQNYGYGSCLIKEAVKKEKPDYVALRTQNPQMYSALKKASKKIYPNRRPVNQEVKRIGKAIANMLKEQNYDEETMIDAGTYGKCMYGKMLSPKNGTEQIFRNLNPYRGDSMICVGEI